MFESAVSESKYANVERCGYIIIPGAPLLDIYIAEAWVLEHASDLDGELYKCTVSTADGYKLTYVYRVNPGQMEHPAVTMAILTGRWLPIMKRVIVR